MRRAIGTALGVMVAVQVSAAVRTAAAQGGFQPGAQCTVFTPKEIEQITKRPNPANIPPNVAAPSEVPKGVSECDYLGISFSLTQGMTPQWFASTRQDQVKRGTKVESLAGVGDDAYWWQTPDKTDAQLGIALRVGGSRLVLMDMVDADQAESVKPALLALAKAAVAKMR